jgi:chitinase
MEQLPFLSQEELSRACDDLCGHWQDWRTVAFNNGQSYRVMDIRLQYVALKRALPAVSLVSTAEEVPSETELDDEDDEVCTLQ